MKKKISVRILMAICLGGILFFGEYSGREPRENQIQRLAEDRRQNGEKQEADYTTLSATEEIEIYTDDFCTFSYNKSAFYLDFQEESSGYTTVSIRALELPRTPDEEEATVFLIGTTPNTADRGKYEEESARIKFQESFTRKFCHRIFNEDEEFEIIEEGYEYYDDNMVAYYARLSSGATCYTRIIRFDDVITYVLLREAEYSHVLNPYYHAIYETIAAE